MRLPALILLLWAAAAARLQAQVPAGGEFRVNSSTTGHQHSPRAAAAADGSFVVAWMAPAQLPMYAIIARRYAPDGTEQTGEIAVGSFLTGGLGGVASDRSGNFVVVWYAGAGASSDRIVVRRFDPAGLPLGTATAVGGPPSRFPDVAIAPSGEFVLAWEYLQPGTGREIFARRFAADATPLGVDFMVNTYTTDSQRRARVGVDGQGSFVVVWASYGQDGSGYGVFARRHDPAGIPIGVEFQVNTYTTGDQAVPAVAMDAAGRFVVAWHGRDAGTGSLDVIARRFDAAGAPLGAELVVNTYTTGDQYTPSLSSDAAGNFVVTWISNGQDGSVDGLFGRRFRTSGAPIGAEFQINTYTTLNQFGAAASDPADNFVAAWHSWLQDGSGYGVFGQRFGGLVPAALAVDTMRNGVFEPGEVVDVAPSWRNVNGAAQTIGGTAVGFTGPQPAVYQVNTPFANYSTIPNGETRRCLDCYRVAVPTTARPLQHWDAVFDERLTPDAQGQQKAWTVHIGASFTDVPAASPFYRFVETLLHHSVTGGCTAAEYCPAASTAREQMAVFALAGKEGAGYRPPACGTPMFADVPPGSPFCPFIEELARRGVVAGCGGGNYCPGDAVSREQMPVFALRTLDPTLDPPACTTPMFADVPASSPFCRWIEELARRGVVTGCGGGNYCPAAPVTREQMAVFIAGTFGLDLYGP